MTTTSITNSQLPIPSHWKKMIVDDVATIKGGNAAVIGQLAKNAAASLATEQETIPLILSGDLKNKKKIVTTKRALKKDLLSKKIEIIGPGSVLLAIARPETAGRCAILDFDAVVNNAIQVLTPKTRNGMPLIELELLFYYFKLLDLQGYISSVLLREGRQYFPQPSTKKLHIPIPPFEEQVIILQRINDLLQEFQTAYSLLDKTKQDLRDLLDPVLAKFFDPIEENTQIPRKRLEDLVSISIQPQDVRSLIYDDYPYIALATVSAGKLSMDHASLIKAETYKKIRQKPLSILEGNSNLILYTLVEPALKRVATFTEERAICDSSNILPLTVKDPKLDPIFLMWSLIAPPFTRFATDQSGGTSIQRISRAKLLSYLLPLPTLVEQQAIVNQLKDIVYTHMEELHKKQIENRQSLDAVEQNILYKAFRGEL